MARSCVSCRVLLLTLFAGTLAAQPASNLGTVTEEDIKKIVDTVGSSDTEKRVIQRRLTAWKDLSASAKYKSAADPEKLKAVNDFMHETPFYCDPVLWCKEDYWAKPIEFLSNDGGDCEDFSIAKYFALRSLGVPDEKLRITYVKEIVVYNEAHMVLAYFPAPDAEPLVLDNINKTIRPASTRTDLVPVYSFNGSGLWLAKDQSGRGQSVGGSDRIGHWKAVQARLKAAL